MIFIFIFFNNCIILFVEVQYNITWFHLYFIFQFKCFINFVSRFHVLFDVQMVKCFSGLKQFLSRIFVFITNKAGRMYNTFIGRQSCSRLNRWQVKSHSVFGAYQPTNVERVITYKWIYTIQQDIKASLLKRLNRIKKIPYKKCVHKKPTTNIFYYYSITRCNTEIQKLL